MLLTAHAAGFQGERRDRVTDEETGTLVETLADELLSRMEVIGNARQILKAMQPTYY